MVFGFAFRKVEILAQAMLSTPEHQLYLLYSILNWRVGYFANPVYHLCVLITNEELIAKSMCVLNQFRHVFDLILSKYLLACTWSFFCV